MEKNKIITKNLCLSMSNYTKVSKHVDNDDDCKDCDNQYFICIFTFI